ncbi:glycosyltransferase family 4 protein [Sphingobacterium deserti]|uniref:Glycosyltransferase n=1 Tax=Sphingobacterium deserti TaxID=1229276 RepID=A0A0B8T8M3_9SPHI|nr:glycosyltransferase family 4 protein [Sphingobacterium deserti]KGE14285.1 glycosyltransferase [Sphingobacterium deserti]
MKKILYVLDQPNLYGSELHLLKLVKLFKEEYRVTVCVFGDGPLVEKLNEWCEVVHFPLKWYPTSQALRFANFLKNQRFDIVHAHQPKALLWGSILGRLFSKTSIVTVHSLPDNNRDSYQNFIKASLVYYFHSAVKCVAELFANKVIYLSKFSLDKALFPSKSLIIPNWINPKGDLINKVFNPSVIRMISVGSVTFHKGYDRLIDALALVNHTNWTLDVYGGIDQTFKEELDAKIQKHGLEQRIKFCGYADKIELVMNDYDFFALFSRGETFGLVYIEAMLHGLPVIAWKIPVLEDIIPDGNFIIEDYSSISEIFNQITDGQYSAISLANQQHVRKRFSQMNIKTIYQELYG